MGNRFERVIAMMSLAGIVAEDTRRSDLVAELREAAGVLLRAGEEPAAVGGVAATEADKPDKPDSVGEAAPAAGGEAAACCADAPQRLVEKVAL